MPSVHSLKTLPNSAENHLRSYAPHAFWLVSQETSVPAASITDQVLPYDKIGRIKRTVTERIRRTEKRDLRDSESGRKLSRTGVSSYIEPCAMEESY